MIFLAWERCSNMNMLFDLVRDEFLSRAAATHATRNRHRLAYCCGTNKQSHCHPTRGRTGNNQNASQANILKTIGPNPRRGGRSRAKDGSKCTCPNAFTVTC